MVNGLPRDAALVSVTLSVCFQLGWLHNLNSIDFDSGLFDTHNHSDLTRVKKNQYELNIIIIISIIFYISYITIIYIDI